MQNLCQTCPAACIGENRDANVKPEYICTMTKEMVREMVEELPEEKRGKYLEALKNEKDLF